MSLQSENINELITSLSKAQGKMTAAAKDSANPFFKSKYADLSSVWNACREALSENGLAVIQTMNHMPEGDMMLVTTLGHSSGQWMRSYLPIKIKDTKNEKTNELQLLGSCLTYLRRYALAAIVGVAPDEDDDGNSGVGYQAPKASQKRDHIELTTFEKVIPKKDDRPDLSIEEVDTYVTKKWAINKDKFMEYMDEIKKNKSWNARQCIENFENYSAYTEKAFDQWLLGKSGL
jgi:hypothetical protein